MLERIGRSLETTHGSHGPTGIDADSETSVEPGGHLPSSVPAPAPADEPAGPATWDESGSVELPFPGPTSDLRGEPVTDDGGVELRSDRALASDSLAPAGTKRTQVLDFETFRDRLRQLASAIAWLHAQRRLHRDLKPSNVMIEDGTGRVVLVDFGLVLKLDARHERDALMGTPGYLAPEICAGGDASPASDWYSFGAIAYTLLAGRLPFDNSGLPAIWAKQLVDARPIEEVVSGVPADVADLVGRLLARDPRKRPAASEILRALGEPEGGLSPSSDSFAASLVGRDEELAKLLEVSRHAQTGGPGLALLHALSGFGKSRLLEELATAVRARGGLWLVSRCFQRDTTPYKALDGVVDELVLEAGHDVVDLRGLESELLALRQVFPVLADDVDAYGRSRARTMTPPEALAGLLNGVAKERPIVIAIDDAQWADEDSIRLLMRALAHADAPKIAIVLAYRSNERVTSPALRIALDPGGLIDRVRFTEEVELGPLSPVLVRELAVQLNARLEQELLEMIEAESGGCPLLVRELAWHAIESGETEPRLDRLVRARLEGLDDPARRLARVVALALEPLGAPLLRELGLLDVAVLNHAQQAHLIRTLSTDRGLSLVPFHDRIREPLVSDTPADEQLAIHEELARTGARVNASAGFVGRHLRAAGHLQEAGRALYRAGLEAEERHAFVNAAELFASALECGHPDRAALLERRAVCLRDAGHGVAAADAFMDLAALSDPDAARKAKIAAVEQYLFAGAYEQGSALIGQLLRASGVEVRGGAGLALARFAWQSARLGMRGLTPRPPQLDPRPADIEELELLWSATIGLAMADPLSSQAIQKRHLRRALDIGDPVRITRAMATELAFSGLPGGTDERRSEDLARRSWDAANQAGTDYCEAFVRMSEGAVHWLRGRWGEASKAVTDALETYESCRGVTWETDTAIFVELTCLIHRGRFAELRALVDELVDDAQARGDLYLLTQVRTRGSAHVALTEGKGDRAASIANEAIAAWTPGGYHIVHFWRHAAVVASHVLAGRGPQALAAVAAEARPLRGSMLLLGQYYRGLSIELEARAALCTAATLGLQQAAGRKALTQADRAAARLLKERIPWCEASGELFRGCAAQIRGDRKLARDALESAARRLTDVEQEVDALAARHLLEQLDGGGAHASSALDQMRELGVRDPVSWTRYVAPHV